MDGGDRGAVATAEPPPGSGAALSYLAVFAVAFAVYLASPVRQLADSRYSLLVCEALLRDETLYLDRYFVQPLDPQRFPDVSPGRQPYQVEHVGGHLVSFFPPGTHALALPFYAVLRASGIRAVDEAGEYDLGEEERAQATIAALVTAGLAVVLLAMARTLLPPGLSLLVALGAAFGTPLWSTASRALWSDTWGVALIGLAALLVLRAEAAGRPANHPLLATLLAWAYFVKPPYAIPIAAISLLVLRRGRCLSFLVVGLSWLLAFVGYSWFLYGRPLPTYYMTRQLVHDMVWASLSGGLVSPSRGLLIYVPVVCFVAYLVARERRRLPLPALAAVAAASIGGHLLLLAFFPAWWGGHGYGPRYMTGLVPWFALLAILGLRARLDRADEPRLRRWEAVAGGLLLAASVALHARGSTALETSAWNYSPDDVDQHPDRLWDWGHPQGLAGLVPPVYDPGRAIRADQPSSDLFFRAGFGPPELGFRTAGAGRAEIWFDLRSPSAGTLYLELQPEDAVTPQPIAVELNGRRLSTLAPAPSSRTTHAIPLPPGLLSFRNRMGLVSGGGVRLFSLRFAAMPSEAAHSRGSRVPARG
jgi:hypothetical protein